MSDVMNPPEDPESTFELPIAELDLMPQQLEVIDPADDWTGVTSARERRRRQNRLNQRTYRKRRAPDSSLWSDTCHDISNPLGQESPSFAPGELLVPTEGGHRVWPRVSEHTNYGFACGIRVPLSLSMVIQLNTFNALAYNGCLLGIKAETLCDVRRLSPFSDAASFNVDGKCPSTLHPTITQQTIPHHPWVDLLPLPRMRDNLIWAFQTIDEREIGTDIVNVHDIYSSTSAAGEKPTLIVWDDPSNPRSWEASPGFLWKWGYLLRGCQELIKATNHWREMRGEKPFVVDVS
ncbi:hypothetical protein BKA56DRAFT_653854 [Ilyonectria sp. MPI-CAGE-AT-0026]|nr:hypothetical protein BKA56DRAFT_653854 [Ilyonectria sp. MPI-CAGE-AT-0026]